MVLSFIFRKSFEYFVDCQPICQQVTLIIYWHLYFSRYN